MKLYFLLKATIQSKFVRKTWIISSFIVGNIDYRMKQIVVSSINNNDHSLCLKLVLSVKWMKNELLQCKYFSAITILFLTIEKVKKKTEIDRRTVNFSASRRNGLKLQNFRKSSQSDIKITLFQTIFFSILEIKKLKSISTF